MAQSTGKKTLASVLTQVRGLRTNAWCASLDAQGLVDRGPEETPLPLLFLICTPTRQRVISSARFVADDCLGQGAAKVRVSACYACQCYQNCTELGGVFLIMDSVKWHRRA